MLCARALCCVYVVILRGLSIVVKRSLNYRLCSEHFLPFLGRDAADQELPQLGRNIGHRVLDQLAALPGGQLGFRARNFESVGLARERVVAGDLHVCVPLCAYVCIIARTDPKVNLLFELEVLVDLARSRSALRFAVARPNWTYLSSSLIPNLMQRPMIGTRMIEIPIQARMYSICGAPVVLCV